MILKYSGNKAAKTPGKVLLIVLSTFLMINAVYGEDTPKIDSLMKKTWENWTYTLALQAATYGAPIVTMYALRHNDSVGPKAKAKPNSIWRMNDISTPELSKESGYVTPNVNTIYGFGFMDLRQEPVILTVPDSNGLYYMVQIVDMWTNAFAYVGGKTTGYKGGVFALTTPQWKGKLPAELKVIECSTPWILLQPRVHVYKDGKLDIKNAKKVLEDIKTVTLSQYLGNISPEPSKYSYMAPNVVNSDLPVSALEYNDPLQFWEILADAMNENPPPANQIEALIPMFKPLGIEFGKPWDRSKLRPIVLDAMEKAASDIGPMLALLPVGTLDNFAFLPPTTIGNFGTDYRTRAVIGRVGLTANIPYEAIYWNYSHDSKSNMLSGSKKYTMTFKKEIPCYEPGFWSITMYDKTNNYTVSNPINRYMLGSDTPEMMKNSDGSFTLYIQKDSPGKDKETNWLPSPSGLFYLTGRSYAPKPEFIKILTDPESWPIPAVIELE
ncbi:MAG: DUF1254 domain-containing protein [Lentisphaerota bacterium]